MINICRNLANTNLALRVEKPVSKLGFINNIYLANLIQEFAQGFVLPILLLLSTPSIILPLLIDLRSSADGFSPLVVSIELSEAVI